MSITIDRLREIIGEVAGKEISDRVKTEVKPYQDRAFELLNQTKSNKLLEAFAADDKPVKGRIGAKYKQLFGGGEQLSNGGFSSLDDVLNTIAKGYDSRLKTLIVGEGSGAGFLVPEIYRQFLYDLALEESIVKKRALVYKLKVGNSMKIPAYADTNRATDGIAGVIATYTPEIVDAKQDEPVFRMISMAVNKLSCFTKTSSELLEDSGIPLSETVAFVLASATSYEEDWQYLNGTGAGSPLGVLNSPCLITIAEEGGQSPGEIAYQNVYKIFGQFMPSSYKKGIWLCSVSLIPTMLALSQPIGTSGEKIRIMKEGKPGEFSLLGMPLIFTDKVPAQDSAGALGLYDFSKYGILQKDDYRLQKSEHAEFRAGIVQWKSEIRHDGQPLLSSTLTLRDSTEVSPFVILGAVT
ncbi:phage major capsid protein [Candidatus Atribacteria bacterium 1244-E10-H5-B2]|nr:MAG: phage major capsid protein [Candidatus Atribacteria bacterium 1244-E10-H5-B2]